MNVGTANPTLRDSWFSTMFIRTAVSYVTGGHIVKAGFTFGNGNEIHMLGNQLPGAIPYAYRFNNGVPNLITLYGYPMETTYTTDSDSGAYVQDKWTIARMTLSAGLRFDHFANSAPESVAGPTQLLPARNLVFPATDGVNFKDLTPKLGAVYDLTGDGKTAVKVSLNKYVLGLSSGDAIFGSVLMPINRVGNATTRSWNDRTTFPAGDPRNGNYVPDCDLVLPGANGECGAWPTRTSAAPPAVMSTTLTSWKAGARAATTGNSRPACRGKSCRASRWTSATSGAGTGTSSSSTTAPCRRRT